MFHIGHDGGITLYNRSEISTMIALQQEESARETIREERSREKGREKGGKNGGKGGGGSEMHTNRKGGNLHEEEVSIIDGALKFR